MTLADWFSVIDEVVELNGRTVQFIGGEPTLNPSLPDLVSHALSSGLTVEIFTNLTHVKPHLWEVFSQPGVRLATSYYSDDATEHDSITQGRGSYARTRANIIEALRRSIPLRVGLIDVRDGQRAAQARAELVALGVSQVGTDRLRQVGRGVREQRSDVSQLCGSCAQGVVAVSPSGEVWPCVFARWMPLGNVRSASLTEIVTGPALHSAKAQLAAQVPWSSCNPRCCPNTMCNPQCSPSCSPSCRPQGNCIPTGNCSPNY